eukprot:Plantae.Rhodophyta-Purpureofilum_apyrenoidigerum.ctg2462.p1 GENE.Plantae.Rhodophyta-Purpureofilum_apyrenoidigerum.ctg2462~~Plantae.Rhodophyta-Purpureofilum_apyrenoidigerum.ctg2462.p1  ORF type:complete len:373 (-),score=49.50 Plantae.Rhodophyta-Purpureofilum_apyrenoidigerum.ctg2462:49-1167(-)
MDSSGGMDGLHGTSFDDRPVCIAWHTGGPCLAFGDMRNRARSLLFLLSPVAKPRRLVSMGGNTICSSDSVLKKFGEVVPPLVHSKHKGQAGRVAILGGSIEYTGAPYFASMSALRGGADLAFIFCHESAAVPIKTYSPELIVYPALTEEKIPDILESLEKAHAITLGPGLGRTDESVVIVKEVLKFASKNKVPAVIDADGLWMVAQDLSIIDRSLRVVLTPNVVEYKRLSDAVEKKNGKAPQSARELCKEIGDHVVMLKKGKEDTIVAADYEDELICSAEGSPRRCGGQGDILSGLTTLFTAWCHLAEVDGDGVQDWRSAAYAASYLTRASAKAAYADLKRSLITSDMLAHVGEQFEALYPANSGEDGGASR